MSVLAAVLAAVLLGVNGWLATSCIAPLMTGGQRDYLVLLGSFRNLAIWCVGAFAVVAIAQRIAPTRGRARAFTPLLLLLLPPAAVAMVATPLARYAPPWLYVAIDLRPWLLAAIAALIASNLAADGGTDGFRPWLVDRRSDAPRRVLSAAAALAVVLAAGSLLSSPRVRFQSVLIGDEPKYLRYLENWYQGRGMDVSGLRPIDELPQNFTGDFSGNLRRFGTAARDVFRHPPARARSEGGWFVAGQWGGRYQVHTPGISVLLLPGYLIDRAFDRSHVWHPQFPTNLYFTNGVLLLMWIGWGLAVFWLLVAYTGRVLLASVLSAIAMLSVPATAFAYQYYPEAAAGLLIALLFRYAVIGPPEGGPHVRHVLYGFLAGYLPWLHVRFLPLLAGAVAAIAWTRRREPRAIAWFLAGAAVPLGALAAYEWHVTGSAAPWAMYALATEDPLFSAGRALHDLPALWLDRTWGLIAHSPVFLFALPGVWFMWRHNRFAATALAFTILAIAIPAAGHGYTAAFTTPGRLIAAVVPLLALPIADALVNLGRSRWAVALFALLAIVSIQNGLTYNTHLIKSEESLHAASISGWLFPALLPNLESADRLREPLTAVWVAITIALIAWPALTLPGARTSSPMRRWSATAVAAAVVIVFAAASSLASAANRTLVNPAFTLDPGDARDRVVHFELTHAPSIRWSSLNGHTNPENYFPNPDGTTTTMSVRPEQARVQDAIEIAVAIRRPGNRPGWGTGRVTFGDGSPPVQLAIEGDAVQRHVYAREGSYDVRIDLELWGLAPRTLIQPVRVDPSRAAQ